MPKFTVVIRDSSIRFFSKEFEAVDAAMAREMADTDESWDLEHGWVEEDYNESVVECGIEDISQTD